jgi:hypothetical protein
MMEILMNKMMKMTLHLKKTGSDAWLIMILRILGMKGIKALI